MYKIGQRLTNELEVSYGQAVIIEILASFYDAEEDQNYYIIKCREAEGVWGWYTQDELDLRSTQHLEKYWEIVKDSE